MSDEAGAVRVRYSYSIPLEHWFSDRRQSIETLARAHATMEQVYGGGRPRQFGRPVEHAYVLRLVAEFQAFVRDLHNLTAGLLVNMAGTGAQFRTLLSVAVTEGRQIDRGNADLRCMQVDFHRLGIVGLNDRLAVHNRLWRPSKLRSDRTWYGDLIALRNALAHGNEQQLEALRSRGVMDTVTWARDRLPGLGRTAVALDRVVWDHVRDNFDVEPW